MANLTEREKDVVCTLTSLAHRDGHDPDNSEVLIDISQSLGWAPVAMDVVPCLCPNGRVWSTRRKRILCGREKMSLQGLFCGSDFPAWSTSSDRALSDLAGNAFSSAVCLAFVISVFGCAPCERVQLV